jgi:hypothetical protein
LLDIRWVTLQEANKRWDKMDWDELAVHDSRPVYPWKSLKLSFPTDDQRENIHQACAKELIDVAHQQWQWQAHDAYRQYQHEQVQRDILWCSAEAELVTLPPNHISKHPSINAGTSDSKYKLNNKPECDASLPATEQGKLQVLRLIAPKQQFPAPPAAYQAANQVPQCSCKCI